MEAKSKECDTLLKANPQDDYEGLKFQKMPMEESKEEMEKHMKEEVRSWFYIEFFHWIGQLFSKYDNSFLIVQGLVFFFQGFKVFLELSVKDLFKQYLHLEPNESQFYTSLISLPWCFKIIYGLIADNFSIFGSRRRSYIIINGISQCLVLWALILTELKSAFVVTMMLSVSSFNSAFFNVVVNALMVTQARKDPENGSSDLQVWAWSLLAIGGIIGAVLSAFFTQFLKPYDTFFMYSLISLCITIAGFFINPELEKKSQEDRVGMGFCTQLKANMSEIKEALKIPPIYRTLLFFFITGAIVPSFGDISYYFSLNVIQFSKFTLSMLTVLGFVTLLCGTMVYNKYFKEYEIRKLLEWNIVIGFIGCFIGIAFALRLNKAMGINDLIFVVFTTCVTDTLSLAFSQLPTLVLFAKITPKHIEATVFAFFTGMFNLSNLVISPNMGVLINKFFVGVTSDHLENYYQLLVIQLVLSFVPLFFLRLIPLRAEVQEVQKKEHLDE